tara:strand:+ start:131 stop:586 length:456 start_codon:yes stop_codon:yes gene_type:complete
MIQTLIQSIHWIASLGGYANTKIERFIRYSISGVITFILDFAILWFFIYFVHLHYMPSATISFIFATLVHYYIVRHWAFQGTEREIISGYIIFSIIALSGLLLTLGLLAFFVESLSFNIYISRLFAGFFVGIWNYNLNLFWNFKTIHKKLY